MNWLFNLPIQRKLTLVMLMTSTLSLVLACTAFVMVERVTFPAAMKKDMGVLADGVAQNSAADLQFGDEYRSDAEKNLQIFNADPHVVVAGLYSTNGMLFARYIRDSAATNLPAHPVTDGDRFEGDYLLLCRPVLVNDRRVGTLYAQVDLTKMRERLTLYIGIAGLVLLASCLLAIVLAAGLQRVISNPLLDLARTAQLISGQKNYSLRAAKRGRDEIGQLTDAFNQMLAEIETGQSALHTAHQSLIRQTREILQSVDVLGSSAAKILEFTNSATASATETATAVSQTTTTVEEVRQTAQASSDKARSVAESAQRAAETSETGRKSTEDTAEGMQRIRQQMKSIAESMIQLNEQGQAIGQIIATVDDLAQQSKILSVNAAIEAAKAGEQGKGFAVVAQEIKSLAEQSRQATTRVRTILNDIQKAVGVAALATEQGTNAVEAGVGQSALAGESIDILARNVAEAAQATTLIATSSRQQVAGMSQVAAAMQSVKQASAQNVASAQQLKDAAQNLDELGRKLKGLVEQYQAQGRILP